MATLHRVVLRSKDGSKGITFLAKPGHLRLTSINLNGTGKQAAVQQFMACLRENRIFPASIADAAQPTYALTSIVSIQKLAEVFAKLCGDSSHGFILELTWATAGGSITVQHDAAQEPTKWSYLCPAGMLSAVSQALDSTKLCLSPYKTEQAQRGHLLLGFTLRPKPPLIALGEIADALDHM